MRLLARTLCILLQLGAADVLALPEPDAWHLLARTGFVPTDSELTALSTASRAEAVERVLDRVAAQLPAPEFVATSSPMRPKLPRDRAQRRKLDGMSRAGQQRLRAWWWEQMASTPAPLQERMVMFWHDRFATGMRKVDWPLHMWRQQQVFRKHALGLWPDLLRDVALDPALLIYLDARRSEARAPVENLARELLELFTLGEGQYSEADVRALSQVLAGVRVAPDASVYIDAKQRVPGQKSLLGVTRDFTPEQAIDLLARHPATVRRLVNDLWLEFVSPTPDAAAVEALARGFVAQGYSVRSLLKALLLRKEFWAPEARGSLIKSPAVLLVGAHRLLGEPLHGRRVADAAAGMGQDLLEPPNVRGWLGGESWIVGHTLVARVRYLDSLSRGVREVPGATVDGALPGAAHLALRFWGDPTAAGSAALPGDPVATVQAYLLDPRFQVH
jgi:uncharacterized protein (DUF1800 family)